MKYELDLPKAQLARPPAAGAVAHGAGDNDQRGGDRDRVVRAVLAAMTVSKIIR